LTALALPVATSTQPWTAIYARISDDRGTEAQGVGRQLEDCHALVDERGWSEDVIEYRDDGYSASMYATRPRPAYARLLADVRAGHVRRIVVWNPDRLYRKPRELEELVGLLTTKRSDVEVVAVKSGDLDLSNPAGRLGARTFCTMGAYEADQTSVRVKRQKAQRRSQGLPHGGRVPIGWRDMMTPDPAEAAMLRESMSAVVHGTTLYDLATRWNAAGLRRHGAGASTPWTGGAVRRVITNPRHAGLVIDHGGIAVDAEGREVVAAWPSIVPRELWEACRAVLAARATGVDLPRRRAWLTGVLRCGKCGDAFLMQSSVRSRPGARVTMLWRHKGCLGIRAEPLEALITEALFEYVDGPELSDALAARDDGRVVAIRAQLAEVDRKQRELVEAFRGGESARAYRMASDALEGDRRRLEVELGRASERSPLEDFGIAPGALRTAWPTMTTDQRRATVLAAFGAVTIAPATRRGRWFDPTRVSFGPPS
jgi:site-specific DNA recombinase